MSSGPAQDVAVEHFLRDIERRGEQLHCAVIGREGSRPHAGMNLLYRKSRLEWRNRESESGKKGEKDSATVGKGRDLASFRRHFRMGFMTMPASQDLSPGPCASAMAPRSQSCHAVGGGGAGNLDNGDYPASPLPVPSSSSSSSSSARCPPAKPKRHPSTRLSSTPDSPQDPPKPQAPPPQPPVKHTEKRSALSDSGEGSGKKVPPLKPRRSPNTQLSLDPPPPRVAPPATPQPRPSQAESEEREGSGDEEPVYIEMVGQVFAREAQNPTPHPQTPDTDSDPSEAIYEEMKYSHLEQAMLQNRPGHHRPDRPRAANPAPSSLPAQSSASSSASKPKATVSISHSSPLPTAPSTPVPPTALSPSPQPPRAPTPFLLPGNKPHPQTDPAPGNKIPAPFPNLLQHRPPLLALPQPAASSSGVGPQNKPPPPKLGTVSIQAPIGLTSPGSPAPTPPPSSASKLPVPHSGPKDSTLGGGGVSPALDTLAGGKEGFMSPAPGLRARSHSTPLPPSSSSSSHYAHPHQHLHPSHYHQYRRPDRDLPTSHSMKLGQPAAAQTPPPGGAKEGRAVTFLLKPDKRDREREREGRAHTTASSQTTTPTPTQTSSSSAPSQAPPPSSSSSQRPSSRPLLHRSHTPHPVPGAGLPAYKPPPSDSPLLWTYPSVGLRGRPPAYDSLRGGAPGDPPPKCSPVSLQRKGGSLTRDGGLGGALGARKLSFSHSREIEREDSRVWNGSTDALSWPEREEQGLAGHSGIPVRCGRGGGGGGGSGEGGAGGGASSVAGRILARAGGEAGWFCAQTMQPAPWGTDDPAPWDPALAPPTAAAAPAAALPPPGSAGAGPGAVPASGRRGRHPLAGPAGRQAAGGDREEALPVPRDQGAPAARQEPVQAGQHARPAQLEADPRAQQGRPPKPAGPAGYPVGHRHLKMAAGVSGVFTLLLWAGFGARIFGERLFRPIRRTDGNRGRRPPERLRGWSEVSGIKGGHCPDDL